MKATLFKTDRNIKILIISDTDYKNILCNGSELFNSHIDFISEFESNRINDLLELWKPDVLLSEKKDIKEVEEHVVFVQNEKGIRLVNNNGNLLLWYPSIDKEKVDFYFSMSFLINNCDELKNRLGLY